MNAEKLWNLSRERGMMLKKPEKNNLDTPEFEDDSPELNQMIGWNKALGLCEAYRVQELEGLKYNKGTETCLVFTHIFDQRIQDCIDKGEECEEIKKELE